MKINILQKTCPMQALEIELKTGEGLPLHDHPQTHVFMYVLSGKLKVSFYRYIKNQKDDRKIRLSHEEIMGPGAHELITDSDINLHRIEALEPSVFLDVMSPGYFECENPPQWFEIDNDFEGALTLKQVPQPEHIVQAKEEALKRFGDSS